MPINMFAGQTSNPARYAVDYETRKPGAIGEWQNTRVQVEMHQSSFSKADIVREAGAKLRHAGVETRFPLNIYKVL